MLIRIISGAQNGADLAGLKVAKAFGLSTGGTMPKGYRTLDGERPEYAELYGITEHASSAYPPRTYANVKDADGTIRFAHNFNSSGEKCTMKAIVQYGKPHFDVLVNDPSIFRIAQECHPLTATEWIKTNNIKTLNIAGNSEKTCPGIEAFVERYLRYMIAALQDKGEPVVT